MMRFRFILLSLVTTVAACGGDKRSDNTHEYVPPKIETPKDPSGSVAINPGFGSGVEKPVVVENKAKSELPPVEHFIPTTLAECMTLGKEKEAKGEHAWARELFEAASKLDRKASAPHVELARSYIATDEKALAIRHASKAVKLAPESSQAYNTLGRAELLRHDYDAAAIAFRQATELDANNVWAWNNLGLVYLTTKNYDEAVNALVEATSRKGAEGYMWNNLGTAYEQLDKLDEARDAFDAGAKLGSVAAKASRKRLEGVESVAIVKKADKKVEDGGTFETREPMPEISPENPDVLDPTMDEHHDGADVEPVIDESKPETKVEEPKAEEKKADEPKVDEKKVDEPKVEPKTDPQPPTTN